MRAADTLTLIRAAIAPLFFLIYSIPLWTGQFTKTSVFIMIPLLAFAEFTDFLDGYIARKYKDASDFGKLFDPFADVLLHLGIFCCFSAAGYMPTLILLLIIYREFTMNFLRMIAARHGNAIGARKGGKLKTVLYVLASFYTLFIEGMVRLGIESAWLSSARTLCIPIYILCTLAAYLSFGDYLIQFSRIMKNKQI